MWQRRPLRVLTIPDQSLVVGVVEKIVKFTLLTCDVTPYLVDWYSDRKESVEALLKRVKQERLQ